MISAHLTIDPHFVVGPINRRLFGSFVEHLGRCVYDGIYEPGHPDADEDGFRRDVIELVKELGVSTDPLPRRQLRLRLPLGGRRRPARGAAAPPRPRLALDRDQRGRPRRVRRAGSSKVGSELMFAVNLGTRGVAGGARPARVRQHPLAAPRSPTSASPTARAEPYGIRMWCLGNEMDGPWQIGHGTAEDYGRLAAEDRARDAAGRPRRSSSSCAAARAPQMPTFGEWERVVLEADLRRRRLHLLPRLLRAERRRPRQLPRVRRRHGPLHRLGRRHRRPRQGRARQRQDDQPLLRRVERLVPVALRTRSTGSPTSTTGRSRRACWRTSTPSPTPSSSATCSSRCCGTPTG